MDKPWALRSKLVVELLPKAPFNTDATMHEPDHFPSADNYWTPGVRWQTVLWHQDHLGLKFENHGTEDQPGICLHIWSKDTLGQDYLDSLIEAIKYRYNLDLDLARFNQRFGDDVLLGPIISKWRGMRPLSYGSLYEYLIIAIVLQNATVRRSMNMMHALLTSYGTLLAYDGKELYCSWSPGVIERTTENELRGLQIGYRAKSIKRITTAFVQEQINEFGLRRGAREEQREALLRVYGIDPASVGYILFDVFHHPDELNYVSPWKQRIYSKLFLKRHPQEPGSVDELLTLLDERFGE